MSYPIEYILEQIDRGNDLDFIARDAGVQVDSIIRRLNRAITSRKLSESQIQILARFFGK